jgi:hypothetical protein
MIQAIAAFLAIGREMRKGAGGRIRAFPGDNHRNTILQISLLIPWCSGKMCRCVICTEPKFGSATISLPQILDRPSYMYCIFSENCPTILNSLSCFPQNFEIKIRIYGLIVTCKPLTQRNSTNISVAFTPHSSFTNNYRRYVQLVLETAAIRTLDLSTQGRAGFRGCRNAR